jgi:hypothetical protein
VAKSVSPGGFSKFRGNFSGTNFVQGKKMPFPDGPWKGMSNQLNPQARQKGFAELLENCYPENPEGGGALLGRPGFQVFGIQLGSVGNRTVQGIKQFTKASDATQRTVVICGGKFYQLDWVGRTATEVLTAANLAAAAVALHGSNRVALTTFSNKLHVSDGVNTPFLWDGTAGGGITKLVNSPALYGPPTVYAARLWGIKAADRKRLLWCEVDDATLGYDTGIYANRWDFTQTDQNPLTVVVGMEEMLIILRARSATAVSGVVTAQFSANHTKEALDGNWGTSSPWAVTEWKRRLYFPDADGRVRILTPGAGVEDEAWRGYQETLSGISKGNLAGALGCAYSPAGLVCIAMPELNHADPSAYFTLTTGGIAAGVWKGYDQTALAMVLDTGGTALMMHGDANGFIYDHGNPDGVLWDDFVGTAGGSVAIQHLFLSQALGYDTAVEKDWDDLHIAFETVTTVHAFVQLITPRDVSTVLPVTLLGAESLWYVAFWDVDVWSGTTSERHGPVRFKRTARWAQVRVTHGTIGEEFGLSNLRLEATMPGSQGNAP